MKLKETLNLGKTSFKMRAGLPNREPEWQKAWEENKIYEKRLKLNKGHKEFILHDGPPYANGNIHVGHALNKISKDIIVRYKAMDGYFAPFVPGWDTHGLPIETALAKKGVKRKEMPIADYLEECRNYALEQVNKQKEDFKRLGVLADFENPYLTLQPEYEASQIRVFGKMAEKGYIYKGLKPIYWSPSSESSLAEAEVEYHDIKSPSLYVAFDVLDGKGKLDQDTQFIIWTTTPWTLPANLGIAVNGKYEYAQVEADGKKYIVAKELVPKISETLGWSDVKELQVFEGHELEYMTAKHPFYDRSSLVILGDHVTLDSGTGLVHTAPGHGEDDYQVGLKYDLEILSPVDGKGCLTDEAPGFEGVFYDKANPMITKLLEEKGKLLKLDFFTHSYPHDWRTKKPVIFRATPQWFASIKDFREDILDNIKKVEWLNPWGETRIYNMIRDRGDWVISRQRAWGVPLPIFYAEDGEPIITSETINHVANLVEKEGVKVWFEREAKDLLPDGFTHPHSPNGIFTKETDIMDVWFDSGVSHEAVLNSREDLHTPADLVFEGSDQYRGWLNSSMTTSVAINEASPYKSVITHGFVLDGEGRKMSKSLGNTLLPETIWKQLGADILRLWVSSVDYESDVRVSMDILKQVSETYRKIRNTMRFLIANTDDFDPKKNTVEYNKLRSVDKYMLIRLQELVKTCRHAYEEYKFIDVYKALVNFCTTELSAFYLDFAKDVVYIESEDNLERRSMQTVFYELAVTMTKLMSPILAYTSEEIWSFLKEPEDYVYLSDMPKVCELENAKEVESLWDEFMDFRTEVLKALEVARNDKLIGKSFEAKVSVKTKAESLKQLLTSLDTDIAQILIVSDFEIVDHIDEAMSFDDADIKISKASGDVCARCRAIKKDVGQDEKLKDLCARCAKIVEENYPEAVKEGFEE